MAQTNQKQKFKCSKCGGTYFEKDRDGDILCNTCGYYPRANQSSASGSPLLNQNRRKGEGSRLFKELRADRYPGHDGR